MGLRVKVHYNWNNLLPADIKAESGVISLIMESVPRQGEVLAIHREAAPTIYGIVRIVEHLFIVEDAIQQTNVYLS
jgi:hypothetical protein